MVESARAPVVRDQLEEERERRRLQLRQLGHGVVAGFFGDDTARRAGRITLTPVPHIDPFGSLILPAMGALLGIPVLAWAKPVPVNPNRMRNPRRDMLYVSLAGPATNFALM